MPRITREDFNLHIWRHWRWCPIAQRMTEASHHHSTQLETGSRVLAAQVDANYEAIAQMPEEQREHAEQARYDAEEATDELVPQEMQGMRSAPAALVTAALPALSYEQQVTLLQLQQDPQVRLAEIEAGRDACKLNAEVRMKELEDAPLKRKHEGETGKRELETRKLEVKLLMATETRTTLELKARIKKEEDERKHRYQLELRDLSGRPPPRGVTAPAPAPAPEPEPEPEPEREIPGPKDIYDLMAVAMHHNVDVRLLQLMRLFIRSNPRADVCIAQPTPQQIRVASGAICSSDETVLASTVDALSPLVPQMNNPVITDEISIQRVLAILSPATQKARGRRHLQIETLTGAALKSSDQVFTHLEWVEPARTSFASRLRVRATN